MRLLQPRQISEHTGGETKNGWNEGTGLNYEQRLRRDLLKRSQIRHTVQDDILESFSFTKHWLHILLATSVGAVILVGLLVYVIIQRRRKAGAPLSPTSPKQPTFQCPPITIDYNRTTQQPQLQIFTGGVHQPVRIKTRGLLERRGSSASLTIDLNPSESSICGTPPKECSAEEYLTSAGNRMTRRQLRFCIKNPKIIHQEFLEIPLNHPEKPTVSGWGNKNRYQTIWPNEWSRVVLLNDLDLSVSRASTPVTAQRCSTASVVDADDDDETFVADGYDAGGAPSTAAAVPPPSPTPTTAAVSATTFGHHSRQHSSSTPSTSAYINANYIRGYDGAVRSFIATQGPLPGTVNDFWRMVWLEKTPCIVMMTKLKEKNKTKCEPYLPSKEGRFGDITVHIRSIIPRNGYFVRDLTLTREGSEATMTLKHFWFTGWPDQRGAPMTNALHLLDLAKDVDACRRKQQSATSVARAVVVHCSAGLGRTGCFIATCICMRQLQEENMVDVLGVVCQMRIDRGGMVQNPEQYEFIHQALAVFERQLPETPTSAALPLTSSSSSSNTSTKTHNSPTEHPTQSPHSPSANTPQHTED